MLFFDKLKQKFIKITDKFYLTNKYTYVAYMRLSNKGDFGRQETNIFNFAKSNNIKIEDVFSETVSGLKSANERTGLLKLFDYCFEHDKIIVLIDSVDRFSRNKKTAEKFIKLFQSTDSRFYFIKEQLLVYPKNNKNVKILHEYVNQSHSEVNNISYRLRTGYRNHLDSGGSVGRKPGYRKSEEEFKIEYAEDIELLKDDYSLRKIKAMTGTSVNTLRKLKKMFVNNE